MPQNPYANPYENLIGQQAMAAGGYGAIPQIQRSQYLADALKSLQDSAGQNIKTPAALGTNLLAEALLRFGQNRSDKSLMDLVSKGSATQRGLTPDASVFGPDAAPIQDGPPPPPAPPMAPMMSGPSPAPQAQAAPPQGSPSAQYLAELIRGGMNPMGASGLVGNFLAESGPNLNRDNPGEGAIGAANWQGPRGRAAQAYFDAHGGRSPATQAAFALQELHGPESKAYAALQAAQDPQAAAVAGTMYERPRGYTPGGNPANVSGWGTRLAGARDTFAQYQPTPAAQPTAGAPPSQAGPPQPQVQQPAPQAPQQPGGLYATPGERQYLEARRNAPYGSTAAQEYETKRQEIAARAMAPPQYEQHFDPSTGQTIYTPKVPGVGQPFNQPAPSNWQSAPETGYVNGPGNSEQVRPGGSHDPNAPQNRVAAPQLIPGTDTVGQADATGRITGNAHAATPPPAPSGYRWSADGKTMEPIPGGPADPGMSGPGGNTSLTGPAYLATLPTGDQDIVKAISEGRMPLPTSFALAKPYWQKMLQQVGQYDPTFDFANPSARAATRRQFTSGPQGQNITSYNTAIGHLAQMDDAINHLGNSNLSWFNAPSQAFAGATGDRRMQAAFGTFQTVKGALASEMVRALRGSGGAESDVQYWMHQFDQAASPDALHAVVKQAAGLLRSRIEAMTDSYNTGMGTVNQTVPGLSPHALTTLGQLQGGQPQAGPASSGQGWRVIGVRP